MSKSVDAIINPELLVWGRETIGYDLEYAADRLKVPSSKLAAWENGKARPTVKQLFKAANLYKRPFVAFYFPHPPTQWDEPYDKLDDWRTLPETQSSKKSPGLVLELRESARRREILIELTEEMDENIPRFDIVHDPNETPSDLAQKVRRLLQVSVADQKSCRTTGDALRMWRLAVENLGVLVFQTGFFGGHYPVKIKEMRGVALHFNRLPIIIMNSKDSETGRIFTIMHELGHLILRQSGLSNFDDFERPSADEVFCNEFAGELLVPSGQLLEEPIVVGHLGKHWNDSDLKELSGLFKVSKEVILRRLLINNQTSPAIYSEKVAKWKKDWAEEQKSDKKSSGWSKHQTKFVRCHGARFVSIVLDAYDRDVIHASKLSDYLGTKLKYIDDIRNDLAKVLA